MTSEVSTSSQRVKGSTYFFGALGGLLFGYDLGVVAGALLFMEPELGLTPLQEGMVTSSLIVGAMVGALACGRLTDRLGRRAVVLISALLFFIGAIGAALWPEVVGIILFRAVMGLAVGAASVNVPVYLSEIAPAHARGRLSGLNQLMISSGILLAYLVNMALAPSGSWRWMFGLAAVPAVLLFIGTLYQPESPRWLVKKGREAEARDVLRQSRSEQEIENEIAEIHQVIAQQQAEVGFAGLLQQPRLRRLLIIGAALAFLQQILGINTIIYYAPKVLKSTGFGDVASITINAVLGVLTVIVTVIMLLFVVDRVGRKRPLIWGGLGMTVCMALMAVTFLTSTSESGEVAGGAAGWIIIVSLAAFKICFSLSWGGIVWIMLGEMFPLRVRGTAMGAATFFNWLGNFIVGLFFPVMMSAIGGYAFMVFAVVGIITFIFASTVVPETKNKTLEEIERQLA